MKKTKDKKETLLCTCQKETKAKQGKSVSNSGIKFWIRILQ